VKNCSGLCIGTEVLIATAVVVDLVVYLFVVGLGIAGRVYPRDSLTRPFCLRLASAHRCL
jgi:hypothetical protein